MQPLPLDTWFATTEVSVTGGPVFLADGRFAGWAGRPMPEERDMWIGQEYFRATMRNPDESYMFLAAEVFLEEAGRRVPETPVGGPRPWIGVSGTEPLDAETARFMGLTDQGAVVISEVLPETPAAEAGLEDRDIVLEIDGEPMPRLRPQAVLQRYFERRILESPIGEPLSLTVLRGKERRELTVSPTASPMGLKEAPLRYFEELGLTLRATVVRDLLQRREDWREADGVIVNFIRPNSPAAGAELQPGDWIREIGGEAVDGFEEATARLEDLAADESVEEIVFLVKRGNETTVLRLRKP
jgi:serine protease Do